LYNPRHKRLSPPLMFAFRGGAVRAMEREHSLRSEAAPSQPRSNSRVAKFAVTEKLVRDEVLKDLTMLVNTIALESTIDLGDFSHVRSSILNFGIPEIASRTMEERGFDAIGAELATALKTYEPRLVGGSITVEHDATVAAADLSLRLVVRGDLRCQPVNVPVEFIADVELATRKIVIERL